MRFRSTLALLTILGALGAYLYFYELPTGERAAQEEQRAQKIVLFKADEVQAVTVRYPAQPEIRIERRGADDWAIIAPLPTAADPREVRSLITTLTDQKASRVVDENNQDLAEYGFDRPLADIGFTLASGEERVRIGHDGALPNTLFVRRDSDRKVFLTEQWIKGSLTRTLFDFRNKMVLTVQQDQIQKLRLEFPDLTVVLEKDAEGWWLRQPKNTHADDDALQNVLLDLANLRATGFVDAAEKSKLIRMLKKPVLTAAIGGAVEAQVRFYRGAPKDSYYAVTSPDQPIAEIGAPNMEEFKDELFHYLDKRLGRFDRLKIDRIQVQTPKEAYRLTHGAAGWALDEPSSPVKTDLVDRLLDALYRLRASRIVEKPGDRKALGLDPPQYRVTLQTGDTVAAAFGFGSVTQNSIYAVAPDPLGVVLVAKDIQDNIPIRSELIPSAAPPAPPATGK